jgi:large subunit ribosomal protein L16|tara:strand:+ start:2365 stop:2772 length:408 start_codon:yes stop_codon:yes gene_type:complete
MLRPKQTKFKKFRKIRIKRIEHRQTSLEFGSFGLRTLEGGQISSKQIEAVRRVITRKLKRTGKLWIRIFPNTPVTKKPIEVRMGKGKGAVDHWVAVVKPGTIIYEIGEAKENLAKVALMSGAKQLSMRCNFVKRS